VNKLLFLSLAAGLVATSGTASAQENPPGGPPRNVIAVGVALVPEFEGAEDLRPLPFVSGDVSLGDLSLQLRGTRARLDILADPRISFGPVVGPRLSHRDVEGPLGLLSEIGTAIEVGAFVGYRFGGSQSGQGSLQTELSVVQDVSDTHNGLLATASVGFNAVRQANFSLSIDAQTTWADSDYSDTYFGISEAEAVVSGLSQYDLGSGFRDVGAGLTAVYWFNNRFGLLARAGASYLVGEIADSPVVDEGSQWQPTAGIALSYRF
jgi:MipA family protein